MGKVVVTALQGNIRKEFRLFHVKIYKAVKTDNAGIFFRREADILHKEIILISVTCKHLVTQDFHWKMPRFFCAEYQQLSQLHHIFQENLVEIF